MRVIEKGRPQKGWAIDATCTGQGNDGGGCGAKLLVEQADLFKTHTYVHVDHDIHVTFKCPECGVLTDLDDGRFPNRFLDSLPDKDQWVDPNSAEATPKKVETPIVEKYGEVKSPTWAVSS